MKLTRGTIVTFSHPLYGTTLHGTLCRTHANGMILIRTRSAMWSLPIQSVTRIEEKDEKASGSRNLTRSSK